MATVTLSPETFTLVLFDRDAIIRVATDVLAKLEMTQDLAITVDETTPVARVKVTAATPTRIEVHAESGAFEDPRKPRHHAELTIATSLARVLFRVRDRADGSFADAPADTDLSLAQIAAWEAYSVGRFEKLGYRVHQPRWLYNFRNRHGFSDTADEVFNRLWSADKLTWGQVDEFSRAAAGTIAA
jgi:hypothetical protein